MNIKNINIKLLAMAVLLGAGALFQACDDVDTADRYVELDPIDAKRTVLLEEFTGQKCVNCPTAHDRIRDLKSQYGDRLVVVSIHAGGNAYSIAEDDPVWSSFTQGLAIPDGQVYANNAGVTTFPSGRFDRVTALNAGNLWSDDIRGELERESPLEIELAASLDSDSETASISIKATLKSESDVSGNLQLWVVESGIVAYQEDKDKGVILDYTHDHVFRGHVNGINGEPVSVTSGVFTEVEHTQPLKSNWNRNNLSIVAFVYDRNGVMQAAEAEVSGGGAGEGEVSPEEPTE